MSQWGRFMNFDALMEAGPGGKNVTVTDQAPYANVRPHSFNLPFAATAWMRFSEDN